MSKRPTQKEKVAIFEQLCLDLSAASMNRDLKTLAKIGGLMAQYANSQIKDMAGKQNEESIDAALARLRDWRG